LVFFSPSAAAKLISDRLITTFAGQFPVRVNPDNVVLAISARLQESDLSRTFACDWHEHVAVKSSALNVVFFHIDWKGKHPYLASKQIDYANILRSSAEVARRSQRDASIIVLTDERTEIAINDVQVVRLPVNANQMMYSRMRAYRAVAKELTGHTLFLDTDVHLAKDFSPVFAGNFDVGLTYRTTHPDMPYNEGVILGKPGAGLNSFFDQALNAYDLIADLPEVAELYGIDPRMWRGGQIVLAALFGWQKPTAGVVDVGNRGIRYRLLPCEIYNYPVKAGESHEALMNKWALHYKGAEKGKVL
jgi:hypothetical protein